MRRLWVAQVEMDLVKAVETQVVPVREGLMEVEAAMAQLDNHNLPAQVLCLNLTSMKVKLSLKAHLVEEEIQPVVELVVE